MSDEVWKSEYIDVYDKVLLNSDIYLVVRDFHINAMNNCDIVLDSGCGTGNVTNELLRQGKTVYAVDNSRKALDILKKKCSENKEKLYVYNLNAGELPLEDQKFDGITSMFVVYYITDYQKYLEETYRVLKDGGVLALTDRISSENMGFLLKSYEESLRKRGLLPKLEFEFKVFKENFSENVIKAVKKGHTFEETRSIMETLGFSGIKEYPNPYFGQCYSLIAHK